MCNIAGYVGTQPAAPILIKMLLAEEGFWGGYYTGIATIHEGKIHYAKLTGDTARLLSETNAASLPGTVGIIHSRSKSGGDDEWAHPFIGEKNGEIPIAYVANGSNGYFADRKPEQDACADALAAQGYVMHSRAVMKSSGYPKLSDGTSVHVSDMMCQLILSHMEKGLQPADAMSAAFCGMPAEIVGLLLSLSHPDAIVWSRINQPMFLGFAGHGAYLATAHIAFPEDAGEPLLLPANASGYVYRDHFSAAPYKNPPAEIAPLPADYRAAVRGAVLAQLRKGEKSFPDLWKTMKPVYGADGCSQITSLMYDIVSDLLRTGAAEYSISRVPGSREDLDAPNFIIRLK